MEGNGENKKTQIGNMGLIESVNYDAGGKTMQPGNINNVWDKRNRMTESRTAANTLLGSYVYNERGLRVKAERHAQAMVQVVAPNGGESFYLGAMNTVNWSGMGLAGAVLKLELLVNGEVAGIIAENLPATQTSYEWQAGKMLSGWASPGSDLKVRVTAVVPPPADGTTYYFYDSGGKLLSEYDGAGTCVKDYLYLGGKMIGEYVPSASSYYYYASDQINSTRLVTDCHRRSSPLSPIRSLWRLVQNMDRYLSPQARVLGQGEGVRLGDGLFRGEVLRP